MPGLDDPNFSQTVTLICQHDDEGAMGLVINRPLDIPLREVLAQMELDQVEETLGVDPVYLGGPVQPERGFVLHRPLGSWEATLRVSDDVAMTASRDVLEAMARGEGPDDTLVALGYAGWSPGQLEQEMAQNAWLNVAADSRLIFETEAAQRWPAAAKLLGVDLDQLSDQTGHA